MTEALWLLELINTHQNDTCMYKVNANTDASTVLLMVVALELCGMA